MERRGDGESWRGVQAALENRQGKSSRDAPNMDQGGGRVSWRVRELRSDLVLPQTCAGGWAADSPRFAIAQDVRSRRRVLRRMDADQFSALRSRRQPESACRSGDEGRPQEASRLDVWRRPKGGTHQKIPRPWPRSADFRASACPTRYR